MGRDDDYRYVRFAFAVFLLIGLVVVGVEGWRHGIRLGTLTVRAIVVLSVIRLVSTIIVGVLRSYEEIQGG